MDDLCKKCKNFVKCIKDNSFDDCISIDYISYSPKNTCEGCFYEDWDTYSVLSPCKNCIRMPETNKKDNYIPKNSERDKYND